MIDSMPMTDVSSAERFERIGVTADPRTAAQTRDQFAMWLQDAFDLNPNRANDLVLAMYEALANTAEFAYLSVGGAGTMDVRATYDKMASALSVTVSDRGMWQTSTRAPGDRSRGRGIALMKALADQASIQTSTDGTTVRLAWSGIHRR
jgi:anti-sigma regulatory factor (Ser/Thr protein kinase)